MPTRNSRVRTAGLWLLTGMFVLAGVAFAHRGWAHWRQEGLDATTALWLLSLLGAVSLTLRYARQARRAGHPDRSS